MTGLLQRLVGQALGTNAPRIWSAERMRSYAQLEVTASQRQFPDSAGPVPDAPAIFRRSAYSVRPDATVRGEHDTSIDPRPGDRMPRTLFEHTTTSLTRIERLPVQIPPQAAASDASFTSQETHTVVRAPTPLLGPVAPQVPQTPLTAQVQVPLVTAAGPEPDHEPTEVHVHIGRIEVTAVHAPAPAKRRASTLRQTQSLTDYLARRRPS